VKTINQCYDHQCHRNSDTYTDRLKQYLLCSAPGAQVIIITRCGTVILPEHVVMCDECLYSLFEVILLYRQVL